MLIASTKVCELLPDVVGAVVRQGRRPGVTCVSIVPPSHVDTAAGPQ